MQIIRVYAEAVARWCLIALALLTPIFFIPGGAVTIPQAKMLLATALVAIAALAWCIGALLRGFRIPRYLIVLAAALLPIAYVLSGLMAGWHASSVVSGLGEQDTVVAICLWFALLLIASAVFAERRMSMNMVLRAVYAGGALLIVFQAARLFFPDALSFNVFPSPATTAAGSWHDFGLILGALVLMGPILLQTGAAAGVWRWLFIGVSLMAFLFLIVVNMSDVWYVLAASSVLAGAYAFFVSDRRLKDVSLWIVIAALSVLFGYFGANVHERLPAKLQVVAIEVRPSWEGTYEIGQQSLGESRTLFFGSGPNSFTRNWALHKPASVNATQFWGLDFSSGVGIVPTTFVTSGIIGFAAWLFLSLAFLYSIWSVFRSRTDVSRSVIVAAALAVVYILVFHVIYAPGIALSALLFLFLGIFAAAAGTRYPHYVEMAAETPISPSHDAYEKIGVGILAGMVLLVTALSAQALTSEIILNTSVQTYASSGDIGQTGRKIERALSVWPSNDRAHRAAVELGILELAQLAASPETDTAARDRLQATLKTAIEHGLAAVTIDKNDYQNWLTVAQLYQELAGAGVSGAYEQAKIAYTAARAENPTNPLPLYRLAQLEALQGNVNVALGFLNDVVTMKQDFAAAYYLASQLFARNGQLQEAVQSGATATQLVPEDPLGWYNLGTILYAAERYPEAVSSFKQATTLNADYANALFMLGLAQYKAGERTAARASLMRVAELNPEDTTVPRMIDNLDKGREPLAGLQANQ